MSPFKISQRFFFWKKNPEILYFFDAVNSINVFGAYDILSSFDLSILEHSGQSCNKS